MKPFLERLAARDELPSASSGPEPFGLESFDPELTTEGLMAERPVEENAEGASIPREQVVEKTSPPRRASP